jgi:hypothetical protein
MFDAICNFNPDKPKTFSIFEFKALTDIEIDKLRYSLICPVCEQTAYFRKASKDGKQACFGSRYHKSDCLEFNPSARKTEEEKQVAEVEQVVLEADSLVIDFTAPIVKTKTAQDKQKAANSNNVQKRQSTLNKPTENAAETKQPQIAETKVAKQGLKKLLTSLLRGSSLADSDLWIYTSDKHKWRAKNLFVNIKDAQPTENNAPRMYWGSISHADKTLNWLNLAEDRFVAVPIAKYRQALLTRFDIKEPVDVEGAGFIIFGKCLPSKDKTRRYIQLWGNDVQYIYLSKVETD